MTEALSQATSTQIEEKLMQLFEFAAGMQVGLREDDSEYDLKFISEKLRKITIFQERLSDIQMDVTRIGMVVRQNAASTKGILGLKEREFKASEDYRQLPPNEKGYWLLTQLTDFQEVADRWHELGKTVSEVKEAVNERAGTIKRLDSDMRLHTKIFEQGVAAGATSPSSFRGNDTTEVDIT